MRIIIGSFAPLRNFVGIVEDTVIMAGPGLVKILLRGLKVNEPLVTREQAVAIVAQTKWIFTTSRIPRTWLLKRRVIRFIERIIRGFISKNGQTSV